MSYRAKGTVLALKLDQILPEAWKAPCSDSAAPPPADGAGRERLRVLEQRFANCAAELVPPRPVGRRRFANSRGLLSSAPSWI